MVEQHPEIAYDTLDTAVIVDLVALMNQQTTRKHLIDHEPFDAKNIRGWIDDKIAVDAEPGCRVRTIMVDGHLAGWCAIQREADQYEIAIVLDQPYWGLGKKVLRTMLSWAREMGHETLHIHFLHSRPEYPFLRQLSRRVYNSEWMGDRFLSYELELSRLAEFSR